MAEPFKNLFNRPFFEKFLPVLNQFLPQLDQGLFLDQIFDENWENLELKQRARHTSYVLNHHLSGVFKKDAETLVKVIEFIQSSDAITPGIEAMFIPDYIEVYGLDHPDISLDAMEKITRFFSCEFAIRPFIIRYPEKAIERMKKWSRDPNPQVRRLSTEGCRPRLPWAMAIPFLKKDPDPILPILEQLKNDEAETVRKSVANNLNDIAKDNPEIVIDLVKKWKGHSKNTDWVVKHGSRTLLKEAHPEALELFGYGSAEMIQVDGFEVLTPKVKMGDSLEFTFTLTNRSEENLLVRLEYGMYYMKANAKLSKKVFKISEKQYMAGESFAVNRKQSFKAITTRKYYPGLHKVSLIINGVENDPLDFELIS